MPLLTAKFLGSKQNDSATNWIAPERCWPTARRYPDMDQRISSAIFEWRIRRYEKRGGCMTDPGDVELCLLLLSFQS